jgi:NADP-dependent 3-hydroxy acid dehydrogenase YdfG
MKTILITGATSGIGEACAQRFAALGYRLILTGRRASRLQDVKLVLENANHTEILTLCFDVRSHKEVVEHLENLPKEWQKIDLLLNNAGLALGLDAFQDARMDDWEQMIDTNIKGLIYVSRAVIPYMLAQGSGHIINVGSIAGRQPYPKGNVYCATKFAVNALTETMRMDLNGTNIRVGQIQPGAVNTEFSTVRFHGDTQRADQVYAGFEPLLAKDIADAIVYMSEAPAHVNIADMLILPTAQASATIFDKK